jgi:hypothetical protein
MREKKRTEEMGEEGRGSWGVLKNEKQKFHCASQVVNLLQLPKDSFHFLRKEDEIWKTKN